MNSRDAAFDESLKEIIEATAAEAAAVHDSFLISPNETGPVEVVSGGKERMTTGSGSRTPSRSFGEGSSTTAHECLGRCR
jgi:hypothetical protein